MKRLLYHAVKGYTSPMARRFNRALMDPAVSQQRVLATIVQDLKNTEYGAHYGINNEADFKKSIPVVNYDDIDCWMRRQREEEGNILVASDVRFYEKTSGSTGPHKYIPYTNPLRRSFTNMFLLWAHDLISNIQGLGKGKLYFSVSPNFDEERYTDQGVPIGLDDDADYLGSAWRRILSPFMLADKRIGKERDPEKFKQALCLSLLGCAELETISIWNPSFLTLVLQWIDDNRDHVLTELSGSLSSCRQRALESDQIDWPAVWPELKLISCWADANAQPLAKKLEDRFHHVQVQGKGLLATEAPMTIPMINVEGGVPLVSETYFEFLQENGDLVTLDKVKYGKRYEIVISQRGGLYRYRMGDQVEVVGKLHNTPTLRFVGRNNRISDMVGEKLNESFVRDVIESLPIEGVGFRSLMAVRKPADAYVLILDRYFDSTTNSTTNGTLNSGTDNRMTKGLENMERMLEAGLQKAYHYRHARALGQLASARIMIIPNVENIISQQALEQEKTLGNIKQNYLMGFDEGLLDTFGMLR
ncbi:MAG: GH3 auxin-responsive promoter [Moraxellaceae bacterium]|nr:MAG: GH3 auxin-responsive promoter [Moraxellaceae bacterium]